MTQSLSAVFFDASSKHARKDSVWQATLEPLREKLNRTLKKNWQEWEIPKASEASLAGRGEQCAYRLVAGPHHPAKEIDKSIAAKAGLNTFTTSHTTTRKGFAWPGRLPSSLSPHRVLALDENDEVIDPAEKSAEDKGLCVYGSGEP